MTPEPEIVAVANACDGFMTGYTPFTWGGPQPGCPMYIDDQASLPDSQTLEGLASVLLHAFETARWRIMAGVDCIQGMMHVARFGASIGAVFPIARTALEGLAYAAWLLEPGISPESRSWRGLIDHRESLKKLLSNRKKQAREAARITTEQSEALDASVDQLQELLRCLELDRAAVRGLLPPGNPERYPSATAVVTAALDDFLGEPGVGTGVYGHLCSFVHPGLPGSAMLFNAGLATGEPNIKLADYCLPVAAACHGMIHAVNRLAEYLGLASPDPYTAPIQDALTATFDLPRETLLRRVS